jgi:hypothetical protein
LAKVNKVPEAMTERLINGSNYSIYESEIRTSPSYLALFAIVFYNVMEFIQNIGITFIVERLRKSGKRLFDEVSNNMDI